MAKYLSIKRNFKKSTLVGLPLEVLQHILAYLIGDKTIHIKYVAPEEFSYNQEYFTHCVCIAQISDRESFESLHECHEAFGGRIDSCSRNHEQCDITTNAPQLSLAILGASRHLYQEGHCILWATNTFSFDDPLSFEKFIGMLNVAQKQKLRKLHLSYPYSYNSNDQPRSSSTDWVHALKTSTLRSLSGVRTLNLCLSLRFEHTKFRQDSARIFPTDSDDGKLKASKCKLLAFYKLRLLNLDNAQVLISDNAPFSAYDVVKAEYTWDYEQKLRHGKKMEEILLDPFGEATWKENRARALYERTDEKLENAMAKQILDHNMVDPLDSTHDEYHADLQAEVNDLAAKYKAYERELELATAEKKQLVKKRGE